MAGVALRGGAGLGALLVRVVPGIEVACLAAAAAGGVGAAALACLRLFLAGGQ